MFASDGEMATNIATFMANATLQWDTLSASTGMFYTSIQDNTPAAIASLTTFGTVIDTVFSGLISTLADASSMLGAILSQIKELLATSGTVAVDVSISSTANTDGSAKSGLPRVPFDGYIAELHKDERVLTAQEAKAYNEGENIRVSQYATTGGVPAASMNETTNNVTINGAKDVDGILRELKRRGIVLK